MMPFILYAVERWRGLTFNFSLSQFKKKQFYIPTKTCIYRHKFSLCRQKLQSWQYTFGVLCVYELIFTGTTIVISSQYLPNSYTYYYIIQFISRLCALNKVGKGEKGLHFGMQDSQKSNPENEKESIGMFQCSHNVFPLTLLHCKNLACSCVLHLEIKANLLSHLMNAIHPLEQWAFRFLVLLVQYIPPQVIFTQQHLGNTHRIKYVCLQKQHSQT